MSYPWISTVMSSFTMSCASFTHSYHTLRSMMFVHCSAVNSRFIPGAILAAIIAASIGNVPLPQNGSTRIRSGLHGVNISRDAASVSVSGALLVKVRYPLLCRESPDVSSVTITSSFSRKIRTGYGAPSSGNHSLWYCCFNRSTIAFFAIDWISDGLNSLLLMEDAFLTQNLPFSGI